MRKGEGKGFDPLFHVLKGVLIVGVLYWHGGFDYVVPTGPTAGREVDMTVWEPYWWFTWLTAGWVMPLFFLVGGSLAAKSLRRQRAGAFVLSRAQRLLIPYYVFAAVMVFVSFTLRAADFGPCREFGVVAALTWINPLHVDCLGLGFWPLWFLQVYIPITLAAPLLWWIHKRPPLRWTLLAVCVVGTVVGDQFFWGVDDIADVTFTPVVILAAIFNFYAVWLVMFWLGFFQADGTFDRHRRALPWVAAATGAAAIALLVFGPYRQVYQYNQQPPSVVVILSGVAVVCLVLWGRDAIVRLFWETRLRRPVDWLSARVYTIYIWHIAGIEAAWWLLNRVFGAQAFMYDTLPFWASRVVFFAFMLPFVLLLTKIFFPVEEWKVWPLRDAPFVGRFLRGRSPSTAGVEEPAR